MIEKNALDVLNRLVAEGKISQYAIAGNQRTWTRIGRPLTDAVDILLALPRKPTMDVSDMEPHLGLASSQHGS